MSGRHHVQLGKKRYPPEYVESLVKHLVHENEMLRHAVVALWRAGTNPDVRARVAKLLDGKVALP